MRSQDASKKLELEVNTEVLSVDLLVILILMCLILLL